MPVGAAIAVGTIASTAYSIDQQKAAARDQERANQRAEQARRAREARERRQMARQATIATAESQMAGVVSGGGMGSSTTAGAQASITSQTAGNIMYSNQMSLFQDQISAYQNQAAKHGELAGYGSQAGSLFMQAGSLYASGGGTTGNSAVERANYNRSVGKAGY